MATQRRPAADGARASSRRPLGGRARELVALTASLDQGGPGALHVDSEYLLTPARIPARGSTAPRRRTLGAMTRAEPGNDPRANGRARETERRRAAAAAHGGRWLEGEEGGRSLAFADGWPLSSFAKQMQRDDGEPTGRASAQRCRDRRGAELAGRVCDHAEPGQVLVSHHVRAQAVGHRGHEFREVGAIELDGLGAPMRGVGAALAGAGAEDEDPALRPARAGDRRERPGTAAARRPGGRAAPLPAREPRAHRRPRRADRGRSGRSSPPKDPQADLRALLSRLRRVLAPATLEGRERLRLALPEPVWLDVEEAAGRSRRPARGAKDGPGRSTAAVRGGARAAPPRLPARPRGGWVNARRREVEELELEALGGGPQRARARRARARRAERASRELIARSPTARPAIAS